MKRKYSCMEDLLRIAEEEYDSFSLIYGCGPVEASSKAKIRDELHPYLLDEYLTMKWPSNHILRGSPRRIRFYRVCQQSLKILSQVPSVFDFIGPRFPEDLIFYLNKEPKFISSAHSYWAYFQPLGQSAPSFRSEFIKSWER